ncbi:MAG: hypothetical protein GXO98_00755 [Nitrospirae bacterium]|nr:hypothetical protein [Nitrospirota bacterium]
MSKSKLAVQLLLTAVFTTLMVSLALAHEAGKEKGANLFAGVKTIIIPYVANPGIVIDGKIGTGEYREAGRFVDEDTGMEAYLLHDGKNLYVGLKNPEDGWVAIGFGNDNEDLDKGGNVVTGYLDKGVLMLREFYASKITGEMEVKPIEKVGGVGDISAAKGGDGKATTIEFTVPLNSTGKYGRHLEPGKIYPLIIAFNRSIEFPAALDRGEIHFDKAYIVRKSDNLKEIKDLFAKKRAPYAPYDTVIAMTIVGLFALVLLIVYSKKGKE